MFCVSEQSGTQQHNRGRSHIAPKNAWKTLGALLSPFFPKRSGGCAPAALSVTRRCGALAAFWKVEMFLSRCGADAPGKNERVAPRPLWARIPRFYIWNNELERAKYAICERPLNLYVCRGGALWLAYHRTQTQSATQWEFLFNPSTDIDSYYSYDTRTRQKCFIRTGYSFQPSIRLNSSYLSLSGNVIVRFWKRDIFRGNGRVRKKKKHYFILHFKNIVIINVA